MEKLVFIIDLDGTVWEDVPNELAHSHTQTAKLFDTQQYTKDFENLIINIINKH